jgi:H+/Cl- antiporter ClcA
MASMHAWLQRVRAISSKFQALLPAQMGKRSPGENAFLVLLPMVGLAVGFTSVATAHVISFLQNQFWGSGQNLLTAAWDNPWYLRLLIPLVGGLLVGMMGWFFRVQTRGGGVTTIMQGVSLKGGYISLRETVPRDWAAIVTISSGGSLGREGAMALLASAIGSWMGRRFRLSSQQLRVLVCASAAAALAAVYNAPIGASLFALEILMGNFALEVLGRGVGDFHAGISQLHGQPAAFRGSPLRTCVRVGIVPVPRVGTSGRADLAVVRAHTFRFTRFV